VDAPRALTCSIHHVDSIPALLGLAIIVLLLEAADRGLQWLRIRFLWTTIYDWEVQCTLRFHDFLPTGGNFRAFGIPYALELHSWIITDSALGIRFARPMAGDAARVIYLQRLLWLAHRVIRMPGCCQISARSWSALVVSKKVWAG
jgi:hypothetical protein